MAILTELFYLPSLEYFTAIADHQVILLDAEENFQKQTYRNRTRILLANKVETLIVPVKGGNKKVKYCDVEIEYDQKWLNVHLRGMQSAYGKSPFFEFYFPYLEQVFEEKPQSLFDLNKRLLTVCLKMLQWDIQIVSNPISDDYVGLRDVRGIFEAKQRFDTRQFYQPKVYNQLFGVDFVPNLSIVDLLFCMGPEAGSVLKKSEKNH